MMMTPSGQRIPAVDPSTYKEAAKLDPKASIARGCSDMATPAKRVSINSKITEASCSGKEEWNSLAQACKKNSRLCAKRKSATFCWAD